MAHEIAIVETVQPSAQREIAAAWHACQQGEKLCIEFGKVCCEWRDNFRVKGFKGNAKGKGFIPILEQCSIPKSTAYWWMEKYEISVGLREAPLMPGKPTDCEVCGLHFRSVGKYEKHRRKDHPDTPREKKPPKVLDRDDRRREIEHFVSNLCWDTAPPEQAKAEILDHAKQLMKDYGSSEDILSVGEQLVNEYAPKTKTLEPDDRYRKVSAFVGKLYGALAPKERTAEIHTHLQEVMDEYV
jgi:hypothetical protein